MRQKIEKDDVKTKKLARFLGLINFILIFALQ